MTEICPVCERGSLEPQSVTEQLPYEGVLLQIHGVEISACNVCGEELVLPEQSRRNDRRFADAKRTHDGLLTSVEITQWRETWGITQSEAASLLGGGANAFSKYERGEVIQSRAMDLLIRVANHSSEARAFLSQRAGIDFSEPSWDATSHVRTSVSDIAAYRVRHKIFKSANEDDGWHPAPLEIACG